MCKFSSFIVTKEGSVYWCEDNNHSTKVAELRLPDNTNDPEKMRFARVELTPPAGDIWEKDLSKWSLKIDETITPYWWTEHTEKIVRNHFKELYSNIVMDNIEVDELKDKRIYAMRNCKVKSLVNTQVGEMWGTSQVGEMWGTSQVGEMWETSQVGVMRETSQVGVMRETSQVGEMRGTSQVGEMWETSQVGEMWGTSQVGEMWETSQVGVMRETSQVGEMWETSQVGVMRETSQVGEMRGTSQVGVMRETSQVGVWSPGAIYVVNDKALAILYFKDTLEVVHSKDTKVKLTKQGKVKGE